MNMCFYIGIEDLVANALIEVLKKGDKRFLTYNEIENYGAEVVRILKENGENLDIQGLVLPFEEKHKVYSLFQQKGLHSFFYKVGPVFLDAARIRRIQRVTEAKIDIQQKARGHR